MKRVFAIALATLFFTATGFAQKGNNQVGGGLDLSFPTGDFSTGFKTGFGLYAKGLYGVGDAGQVTFTTGYSTFKMKGSTSDFKMTMGIIPLLVGYRHYYQGFFAEPQIGYGIYRAKVKTDLDELEDFEGTDSEGAFTWALNVRTPLERLGVTPNRFLATAKDGQRIKVAGLVLVRQRPGTASGVIFMTLEDEDGIANIVVWPKVFETYRRIVLGGRMVMIEGKLQREGIVVHIVADRVTDLTPLLHTLNEDKPDISRVIARADEVKRATTGDQRLLRQRSRDFH